MTPVKVECSRRRMRAHRPRCGATRWRAGWRLTAALGKMVANPTLQEQAQANDTVEPFGNGACETKLNNAVVDALDGHAVMADQALRHPKVFKRLAELLVEEVEPGKFRSACERRGTPTFLSPGDDR